MLKNLRGARRFSWSANVCAAPVAARWNVELRGIRADTASALFVAAAAGPSNTAALLSVPAEPG